MDLANIKAHLQQMPEFDQVVEAGSASTIPQIDTELLLKNILATTSENVYCLKLPEEPPYPNITYVLVGGRNHYFEKQLLTQVDVFVVSLREKTLDALAAKMIELFDSIHASPFAIEITDKQKDFEHDRECFRLDIELSFSVPATGINAQTPALIVYSLQQEAEESDLDNFIKQRVITAYGLAILTANDDLATLQEALKVKMLGYQQTPYHDEMQFARGSPVDSEGGLRIWREVYQDSVRISQQT